jgi:DNA-binding XRE family transcriptional regulator
LRLRAKTRLVFMRAILPTSLVNHVAAEVCTVGHECPTLPNMLTRETLAEMLSGVNVEDLAKEAEVSVKTIYRLRHQKNAATLDTAEKLAAAVARLKKRKVTSAPVQAPV